MKSTVSQIEVDEKGVAWIAAANTKVIEVAADRTRGVARFEGHCPGILAINPLDSSVSTI
jgi:hypothetical protein